MLPTHCRCGRPLRPQLLGYVCPCCIASADPLRIIYKHVRDVDDALRREPASVYWRLHLLAAVNWLGQVTPERFVSVWREGIDLPYPPSE